MLVPASIHFLRISKEDLSTSRRWNSTSQGRYGSSSLKSSMASLSSRLALRRLDRISSHFVRISFLLTDFILRRMNRSGKQRSLYTFAPSITQHRANYLLQRSRFLIGWRVKHCVVSYSYRIQIGKKWRVLCAVRATWLACGNAVQCQPLHFTENVDTYVRTFSINCRNIKTCYEN